MKKLLLFLLSIGFLGLAYAHSGRTDSNGGHWNRSTDTYHCHSGPCSSDENGIMLYILVGIALIYTLNKIRKSPWDKPRDNEEKESEQIKFIKHRAKIYKEKASNNGAQELTPKEINQSDYDLFSQEIELINKAIAEELLIEFLYDGTYGERIKIMPIEFVTDNKDFCITGFWTLTLDDEENRNFALRKMSNIKVIKEV